MSSSSTWAFTNFYPRPPRGGRPSRPRSQPTWAAFLSTPSARRATGVHFYKDDYQFISIHALREEGDILQTRKILARDDFYPRPPRGGRPILRSAVLAAKGISIHALREEGDSTLLSWTLGLKISIHALREEGDTCLSSSCWPIAVFLSTPSARRATCRSGQAPTLHADFYPRPPRGGRQHNVDDVRRHVDFYPRPPRGGRQDNSASFLPGEGFLSTPSARRATHRSGGRLRDLQISIHALREEGDRGTC